MEHEAEITGNLDINELLQRFLALRGDYVGRFVELSDIEVRDICLIAREIFLSQPPLIEIDPPVKVIGDIHGQFPDLLQLMEYGGFPPLSNYLFLGDYVDRGRYSIETICFLLLYKIRYPENFFLLRGNHECASITRIYGFYDDVKRRWGVKIWKTFMDCFNCMPVCAIIGDKIICMHGGISPHLYSMDQIRNIERPVDIPEAGILCDLVWADPDKDTYEWAESDRGVSYIFGAEAINKFLRHFGLDLICRAHQVVEDGYEFFAKRQCLTLFSAPNYCGEYDNAAAIMSVDESLLCSFQILKPSPERKERISAEAAAGS